ncbi:MAG TPA: sugar ABC transporter permease [Candidatus Blautia faecipullorum]|nr:sugar ABC transporter permease [Candidatus Blautia faecipullorum]
MKKNTKQAQDQRWGYALVAPTIIGLLLLNVYPFVQTIYLSFTNAKAFGDYDFVGLSNFATMFTSSEFWRATWNTILFCILTVPVGVGLALVIANLLNSKIKGKVFFRAVYFLPMVVAPAAVAMVWKWMFNSEYGIINSVFHIHVDWITNPNLIIITVAIVAIWSALGYDAVLLLSGLQNISKSYYEAASLDGATKFQQFVHITLPMVSPTLFVVLIMRLMASLKIYDLIYMMVGEGNPALSKAQSLIYLFYRESFVSGNRGYASAIVIWTVVIIAVVTVIQFIGQKKWVNYEV